MTQFLLALPLAVFPGLLITAALRDAVSFTIPNWIPLALIMAFALAALAGEVAPTALVANLGVGTGALVLGMGMFAAGCIGGGDAKLFAAAALWLGWPAALTFLAVTGVAGGALAVGLLSLRAPVLAAYMLSAPAWLRRLATAGENVPYGVAIAVGGLAAFPASTLMTRF